MIEQRYIIAIGDYLEARKNVNRYKNRLHRFRNGKLGLNSQIALLQEMGYKVEIVIFEPLPIIEVL